MTNFGMIHELASLESRVRRQLMNAQHQLHCVLSCIDINQEEKEDQTDIETIKKMVNDALSSINEVCGK